MKYVNLIIDNSSDNTDNLYTYGTEIPGLKPGDKVLAPFSIGNRIKEAYVHSFADAPADDIIKGLKYVIEKDADISLPSKSIEISNWMRERYFCRYIDAVKCFAPAGKAPKRDIEALPLYDTADESNDIPSLTVEQAEALKHIKPYIDDKLHKVFLIHGVTSSGKTELYMRVIAECLEHGRNAIMLVPEISLTKQTIERFTGRFGTENIAVLHSKLKNGQRYQQWMRIKNGQVKIVVGARSAVFAPFDDIGAIILDEEHEITYKSDKTPKYDTAEVAIELGRLHNSVVLLGSATPSLTSSYRADHGIYERIRLTERYNKAPLPEVEIVDMREQLKNGNKSIFSLELYYGIKKCLEERRQVILFLNRRGYSSFLSCRSCGYVMKCSDCSISLTYHKERDEAVCHYCGKREKVPSVCPGCGSRYIKHFGTGTEKVEELALQAFPEAAVDRLDLDTASKKGGSDRILTRFGKGKTDILIGTQLVAKGLDFANVGLVGIVAADISLNIPDYRSPERTFQLITQAAGRAGRGDKPGKVIIQTYTPSNYAIRAAAVQDYQLFYKTEIEMRRKTGYPPYCDLIQLVLSAKEEDEAKFAAEKVKDTFLQETGMGNSGSVLGPRPAPMSKVNGLYRYQLLIKCFPECWETYKNALISIKKKVNNEKGKEWIFLIDVNPFGFL